MHSYSLLSSIIISFTWLTDISLVSSGAVSEYSWLDTCDASCWIKTVDEHYESLHELYEDDNVKELVISIEDWYEVSYLSYYMNELDWGKKFDATKAKDVEATRRWGLHEEMLYTLAEQGHTFDDYQREKIKMLGPVGKKYAEKHYGKYDDVNDLDLSFNNYILTFDRDECGSDCADFVSAVKPYIITNLLYNVLNNMGVGLSIGYEFDIIAWHRGYGIGLGVNGFLNRLALFESYFTGKHLIGIGVTSSLDLSLFDDFDNMPGDSNYIGLSGSTEAIEYDIGASLISAGGQLIGVSCSLGDGIGVGSPISLAWGDDTTTFIYSTDDAAQDQNGNNKDKEDNDNSVGNDRWPFGPEPTDEGVRSNRWPFGTDVKGVNANRWPFGTDATNKNKEMNVIEKIGEVTNDDLIIKVSLFGVIALLVGGLYVFYTKTINSKDGKYTVIPEQEERRPLIYV